MAAPAGTLPESPGSIVTQRTMPPVLSRGKITGLRLPAPGLSIMRKSWKSSLMPGIAYKRDTRAATS